MEDETPPPPIVGSSHHELAANPALQFQLVERRVSVAHDDASITYLLTGRLRL